MSVSPWYQVRVKVGRETVVVDRLSWGDAHQVEVAIGLVLTGVDGVHAVGVDGVYLVKRQDGSQSVIEVLLVEREKEEWRLVGKRTADGKWVDLEEAGDGG